MCSGISWSNNKMYTCFPGVDGDRCCDGREYEATPSCVPCDQTTFAKNEAYLTYTTAGSCEAGRLFFTFKYFRYGIDLVETYMSTFDYIYSFIFVQIKYPS